MILTLLACGGSVANVDFDGASYRLTAKRDLEYNPAIESVYIIFEGSDGTELSYDAVGAPQHGGVSLNWFEVNGPDGWEELGFGGSRVTEITWSGGASPWTMHGVIDGETGDGRAVTGTFDMQAPDCSTTIFPLFYCGGLIRSTVHGDSQFRGVQTVEVPAALSEQVGDVYTSEEWYAVPYDGATMTAPSGVVLECEAGRLQETGWGGDYTVLCHAEGEPFEADGCSYEDVDLFGSPHWFLYATAGSSDPECPALTAQMNGDWAGIQGDPPEE